MGKEITKNLVGQPILKQIIKLLPRKQFDLLFHISDLTSVVGLLNLILTWNVFHTQYQDFLLKIRC